VCSVLLFVFLFLCVVQCGDSVDQTRTIALTIVVALSAMVFLSIAVMMLKARPLAYAVQAFIVFQELASVSVQGVKDLPRFKDELTMVATYANMVSQRRAH
jgi:hypothetical protein